MLSITCREAPTLCRIPGPPGLDDPEPTVFLVDSDPVACAALAALAAGSAWRLRVFGSASDFLARRTAPGPGCLLLASEELGLQAPIARANRELPIIVLARRADIPTIVRAVKAGAAEVLPKPVRTAHLREVIGDAIGQSRALAMAHADLRRLRDRYDALTAREREVMALVVEGLLNKQIAFELSLREITVKVHRMRMMAKMGARSLPDLVRMSARLELLEGSLC